MRVDAPQQEWRGRARATQREDDRPADEPVGRFECVQGKRRAER